jgi:hypothetical protein
LFRAIADFQDKMARVKKHQADVDASMASDAVTSTTMTTTSTSSDDEKKKKDGGGIIGWISSFFSKKVTTF